MGKSRHGLVSGAEGKSPAARGASLVDFNSSACTYPMDSATPAGCVMILPVVGFRLLPPPRDCIIAVRDETDRNRRFTCGGTGAWGRSGRVRTRGRLRPSGGEESASRKRAPRSPLRFPIYATSSQPWQGLLRTRQVFRGGRGTPEGHRLRAGPCHRPSELGHRAPPGQRKRQSLGRADHGAPDGPRLGRRRLQPRHPLQARTPLPGRRSRARARHPRRPKRTRCLV